MKKPILTMIALVSLLAAGQVALTAEPSVNEQEIEVGKASAEAVRTDFDPPPTPLKGAPPDEMEKKEEATSAPPSDAKNIQPAPEKRKFGQARSPGKFGPGVTKLEAKDSLISLGIPVWRILLALLIMGGLMVLFFFGLKRFGNRIAGGGSKNTSMKVVGKLVLDGKNSVVMLRVYEEDLLLGVGPNGVQLLSRFMSIDGSSADEEPGEDENSAEEKLKAVKEWKQ